MIMADTKEVDTAHRLYRTMSFYSLRKQQISRQWHLNRLCHILQGTQVLLPKWKPGPQWSFQAFASGVMPKVCRGACSGKAFVWHWTVNILLLVLPQSKLVENTARFLQDKINMEKCGRDWICSQKLVSSLTQTKFYRSQSQYFPTDNIPALESEASLLDLSSKGKCSIPMKNLEIWEKRARKLIAINSHADNSHLLCTYVYSSKQCLCQLFRDCWKLCIRARCDAALAMSKILFENSNHQLRNAPINSETLFGKKIEEVAKGNFEAQQQRFLATSSVGTTMQQQQKVTYPAPSAFKKPKQPAKPSRPQQTQSYRPKINTQ